MSLHFFWVRLYFFLAKHSRRLPVRTQRWIADRFSYHMEESARIIRGGFNG